MPNECRWIAHRSTLTSALMYSFPLQQFTQKELMELDRVTGTSIQHAIGLPKASPAAFIQEPIRQNDEIRNLL